jgi:hypothetical protein
VESDLSPGQPAPLVELQYPSEFLSDLASSDIGFAAPLMPSALARWTTGSSQGRIPVPTQELTRVSSHELPLSFRDLRSPSGRRLQLRPKPEPSTPAPPVEFVPLQRVPAQGSGMMTELPHPIACAFRFSQPPDASVRPEPAGLVSCRIRSWGSPFRALLLPCSRSPSPAPLPS